MGCWREHCVRSGVQSPVSRYNELEERDSPAPGQGTVTVSAASNRTPHTVHCCQDTQDIPLMLDTVGHWTLDSNGPDTGHSRMDRDGPLILDSIGPNFGHSTLDNRYWTPRHSTLDSQ